MLVLLKNEAIVNPMENESALDRQFREIVADCNFDQTSIEQRMLSASTDMQLVIAVQDTFSAYVAVIANLGEPSEQLDKYYSDAQQRLLEVTINLQYSYGLSDEDMRKTVELTRANIAESGTLFD